MYISKQRLLILDADGTTIDAFSAIEEAFFRHGLVIGDETRFQKRHHLFKYLGGVKEFPSILKKNLRRNSRARLVDSLTEVYRHEASLYEGIPDLIRGLIAVSYGFEDRDRLTAKYEIPHELISRIPDELCRRVRHALDLDLPTGAQ